jgi:hypothetical protein
LIGIIYLTAKSNLIGDAARIAARAAIDRTLTRLEHNENMNAVNLGICMVTRAPARKLSPKETRELEGKLPIADPATIEPGPFPPKDSVAFARLYRYLPSFASFEP